MTEVRTGVRSEHPVVVKLREREPVALVSHRLVPGEVAPPVQLLLGVAHRLRELRRELLGCLGSLHPAKDGNGVAVEWHLPTLSRFCAFQHDRRGAGRPFGIRTNERRQFRRLRKDAAVISRRLPSSAAISRSRAPPHISVYVSMPKRWPSILRFPISAQNARTHFSL